MIQFRENLSPLELAAYLRQYPEGEIIDAAKVFGWRFSRGRPSARGIIAAWETSYPRWMERAAKYLHTKHSGNIPAAGPIPSEWDENPVHDNAPPSADITAIQSAIDELRATDNALTRRTHELVNIAHDAQTRCAALEETIRELEKRQPVQFIIDAKPLPVITGQHFNFPRMIKWLQQKENVLLVGPAGTGKTTAAIKAAELFGIPFYSQPLTMDAFGVFGFVNANGEIVETEFSRAWKGGGVFLWDELSMSSADALGALNAALANRLAPLPGVGTVPAHPDFYCIAADNSDTGASLKFAARTVLDGASLDRFIRINWPIDAAVESSMAGGFDEWLTCVRAVRDFIETRDIQHVGATPRAVLAGAKALHAGLLTRMEILEDTLCKGVLVDSWPEILKLEPVREYLASGII